MARRRIPQLVHLLLLLPSSCAWAHEGARRYDRHERSLGLCETFSELISSAEATEAWRIVMTESDNTEIMEEDDEDIVWEDYDDMSNAEETIASSPPVDSTDELRRRRTPTQEEAAYITTPPSNPLVVRQDQSQIDQLNSRIQSLQQSAQQALQSLSDASRQVSQASQQLSQSSQQLSQQSQRLSQSSQQLSQSLQQATQSINLLNGGLSSAISSGSSALASCTSSAAVALSSALASASNDAATKVGAALSQATIARDEADREVQQAQGTAVSITQAAAAIIGTFIGSSLLTILLVFIILRYRRKRKQDRDEIYGGRRPGTSGNYNSMVGIETRDMKEAPIMSPDSGTTKVGSMAPGLSRVGTVGSLGREGKGKDLEKAGGGGGGGGGGMAQPTKAGALPKLGIVRNPTGEALSTNYVRTGTYNNRKPVQLSEPPPAKKKAAASASAFADADNNNNNNRDGGGGSASSSSNHTWSVFPKIDPDPRGLLTPRAGASGGGGTATGERFRPDSAQQSSMNLQTWLQTASVSPFAPVLEKSSDTAAVADGNNTNGIANGGPSNKVVPAGGVTSPLPSSRLSQVISQVKWPLQDPRISYGDIATPTVGTATVARSVSMKGIGLPGKPKKLT